MLGDMCNSKEQCMLDVWQLCKQQATCVEKLWRERMQAAQQPPPADPLPAEGAAGAEGLLTAADAAQGQRGAAAEGAGAKLASAEAASAQVCVIDLAANRPCCTAPQCRHA